MSLITFELLGSTNLRESPEGSFSYCFGTHKILEKSKIKNRACFGFPDPLGTKAKETTDEAPRWQPADHTAVSLLVQKTNGGREPWRKRQY
jgi:hypothetical protein